MPAETAADSDSNGLASPSGESNPFPSASVVVLFAATTSDPEEPVYAAQEDAVQPAGTALTEMVTARLAAGQTCVLRVRTGSMTPLLQPGDAVRVASLGGMEPRRGALLVVRQGGHLVTHRLVGWVGAGAGRRLLLQGDACHRPDQPVAPTQLVGVVVARRRQGRWAPVTRWGVLWPLEMSGLWVWLYSVLLRR